MKLVADGPLACCLTIVQSHPREIQKLRTIIRSMRRIEKSVKPPPLYEGKEKKQLPCIAPQGR